MMNESSEVAWRSTPGLMGENMSTREDFHIYGIIGKLSHIFETVSRFGAHP